MRQTLTVAVALLISSSSFCQKTEFRILATHEEPTKEQAQLLNVPDANLKQAALKANVEVVRDGDDILLFDADLYNIRRMNLCIEGFNVLSDYLRKGRSKFTLGELSEKDKQAVQEIFLAQGAGRTAGPVLFDDQATVHIGAQYRVKLSASGQTKTATGWAEPKSDPVRELPRYSDDEVRKFVQKDLPSRTVKWHSIKETRFLCDDSPAVESERRVAASAKIMKIIEARLKRQAEQYRESMAALASAFRDAGSPSSGEEARALDPYLQKSLANDLQSQGMSGDQAADFIGGAKIDDVDKTIEIGVSWQDGSVGRTSWITTNVNRNHGA